MKRTLRKNKKSRKTTKQRGRSFRRKYKGGTFLAVLDSLIKMIDELIGGCTLVKLWRNVEVLDGYILGDTRTKFLPDPKTSYAYRMLFNCSVSMYTKLKEDPEESHAHYPECETFSQFFEKDESIENQYKLKQNTRYYWVLLYVREGFVRDKKKVEEEEEKKRRLKEEAGAKTLFDYNANDEYKDTPYLKYLPEGVKNLFTNQYEEYIFYHGTNMGDQQRGETRYNLKSTKLDEAKVRKKLQELTIEDLVSSNFFTKIKASHYDQLRDSMKEFYTPNASDPNFELEKFYTQNASDPNFYELVVISPGLKAQINNLLSDTSKLHREVCKTFTSKELTAIQEAGINYRQRPTKKGYLISRNRHLQNQIDWYNGAIAKMLKKDDSTKYDSIIEKFVCLLHTIY